MTQTIYGGQVCSETVKAGDQFSVSVVVGGGASVQRFFGGRLLQGAAVTSATTFGPYPDDMVFRVSAYAGATVTCSAVNVDTDVATAVGGGGSGTGVVDGYLELTQQSSVNAGSANTARLYAADTGAGGNGAMPASRDADGIRPLGFLGTGSLTLTQLLALSTTNLTTGVTKAVVNSGTMQGTYMLGSSGWIYETATVIADVVSQSATGTALSGAGMFAGVKVTSGTVTLTVYDATSASGSPILTVTSGTASGGSLSNGYYPWAAPGQYRPLANGCHVVLSGTGTWDVLVSAA